MIDCANSKCRITGKICFAWSEVAGCGLVRCKFMEKKDGGEVLNGETVTERHQMTNADRINAMTIEEKAEFLSSIAYGSETPWSEQFAEKFCKSCPTETCTVAGYHHPMDLHECDFADGKCPHGDNIVWWLQQPSVNTT